MSEENEASVEPTASRRGGAPSERELDEIAVFLSLVRRAGEPGPESWLYTAPRVASPRASGRGRPAAAG